MVPATPTIEAEHIVDLSSPQQVIAFFTRLGYATALERNEQSAHKLRDYLHQRSELRAKIKGVTQIALQKDEVSTLYVYLYILSKLTRTTRREIVNDLQTRQGDYLLVLADQHFHELEFVYLDRVGDSGDEAPGSAPLWSDHDVLTSPARPRPRPQRVDRRH